MKICIPTEVNNGLKSIAYSHFGSAPYFIIYDTDIQSFQTIENANSQHEHGNCNPVGVLADNKVNAVIVGGMGMRALQMLNSIGVRVFRAYEELSVEEIVLNLGGIRLKELTMSDACSHHHN